MDAEMRAHFEGSYFLDRFVIKETRKTLQLRRARQPAAQRTCSASSQRSLQTCKLKATP
jgi:hypothetical protein